MLKIFNEKHKDHDLGKTSHSLCDFMRKYPDLIKQNGENN